MPYKLFPVRKTVKTAVWEETGTFTKYDIIRKLRKMGVCPHPIAEGTVRTMISEMARTDLDRVGGFDRREANYRNKVDYRLRLILDDIRDIENRVKELIQEQQKRK